MNAGGRRWLSKAILGPVIMAPLLGLAGSVASPQPGLPDLPVPPSAERVGAAAVRVVPLRLPTLRPGIGRGLDVHVENPNPWPVVLTRVQVQVAEITGARVSASRPCGPVDFHVRAGTFAGVQLASGRSTSLSGAGIPYEKWPRVEMINSRVNQDGCQGAQLALVVQVEGRMA